MALASREDSPAPLVQLGLDSGLPVHVPERMNPRPQLPVQQLLEQMGLGCLGCCRGALALALALGLVPGGEQAGAQLELAEVSLQAVAAAAAGLLGTG